jgi:hypothetical protein
MKNTGPPNRSAFTRMALMATAISPFVIGLGPPDTSGTYVSFTGGGGRSSYTTSSCGYTDHVRSSFYNAGMAADHRMDLKKGSAGKGSKLGPRYFSFGVSGNQGVGRTYEFQTLDSPYTGERLDERRYRWRHGDLGARAGFDWRHIGISAGVVELDGEPLPSLGFWIGDDIVYYSFSALEQPVSLNAVGETGVGIHAKNFRFWYGLSVPYGGSVSPTLKFGHAFESGTIGFSLLASPWGDDRLDYGASLQAQYRLPFQ